MKNASLTHSLREILDSQQLIRYAILCAAFAIGPVALGWTDELLRPISWLAAVLMYRFIEETGYDPSEHRGQRWAVPPLWALHLAFGSSVLLPSVEFVLFPRAFTLPYFAIGFCLVGLGTVLRYLGVKTLGRHFSVHVEVRPEHKLVDSGIYRFIRHPGYAGVICFTLGSALVLHAWYSLAYIVLVFWPLILVRIYVEERALSQQLEGYGDYIKRSKRLIPFVL